MKLDHLAHAIARLGLPGLAGLGLGAAGLILALVLTPPLRQQTEELETRLQRTARPAPAAIEPITANDFPAPKEAAAVLAGLFQAARHAGLSLDEGNYRVANDHAAGLVRQQITLPLAGTYPALRTFLAEALNRHPGLALEGLRLDRVAAGSGELAASLRFTLYLREEP